MEYIALDVHKKYTWARVENPQGERLYECRLAHAHGTIKNFVHRWSEGSPVAVETVGNWYWVVDEIEGGGGKPQLVNARLAKLMMGMVNTKRQAGCERDEPAAKKRDTANGVDPDLLGARCP